MLMPTKSRKTKGSLGETLGKRIQTLRKAAGVATQEAWARKLGMEHNTTISDWETGKAFSQLDKIGDALRAIGANPTALLGGDFEDPSLDEAVLLFQSASPSARGVMLRVLRAAHVPNVKSAGGIE